MDKMYGMRCAADALNVLLIALNVLGAIMAALIVLQMKGVARWRIFRPLAAVFCRVCRIPYGATLGAISVDINERYKGKESDALNYVDRVVDRQINKARGILPFNSVIITALSLNNRSQYGGAIKGMLDYLSHTVIAALFISSLLLLELFWVQWGRKPGYYKNFTPEVTTGLKSRETGRSSCRYVDHTVCHRDYLPAFSG